MATPSILIVPDRYKSGVLYSQLPENGAVDFDVTRATPAFRTNASGILDSTASGVPRLDYPAAGGCPALLVEPAATNLALRSEEFNDAYWVKTETTVTANASTAPDGTTTADKLIPSVVNAAHFIAAGTISFTSGTTYTWSVFAKKDGYDHLRLAFGLIAFSATGRGASFNLNTGAIGQTQSGVTARIQNVGNGYYRCSITATAIATASDSSFFNSQNADSATSVTFAGDGTSGALLWGAQLETGSVATSYIPTTSAAVTRNADVISKTGVSGFIGQSVGTLYAEVDVRNFQTDGRILAISNGTSDNRIALLKGANSTLRGLVTTASGSVADIATASGTTAGVYKIALAYAADDFVLYVNGSQIGTDTSGAVPACTDVYLGKIETSGTTNQLNDRIRAAAIYTTRLSNTELAALTSL
jgi:hypothetical protein